MSHHSVCCLSVNYQHADSVIHRLIENQFSAADISILLLVQEEISTRTPFPSASRRSLLIPKVGYLIAQGPVMAQLSEALVHGIAGSLLTYGVGAPEATRFEECIRKGYVFLSVRMAEAARREQAGHIFYTSGAEDVRFFIFNTKRAGTR